MPRTKPTDPLSVESQLADMNIDMLGCRDLGHNWQRGVALEVTRSKGSRVLEAERVLECMGNCGVTRTDVFARDAYGDLIKIKAKMSYPPGYVFERADPEVPVGRVPRTMARRSLMSRLLPGLSW